MARKRTIDRDLILDAAEHVIARDGAVHLTLDAVALEAGVSKGSVVYDHKTKQALISAIVQRALSRDNAFNTACADALAGPVDSRVVRGRIAAATNPLPAEQGAIALSLCAALAQDAELRAAMQRNQSEVIQALMADAASPRSALLAYLALEGLKLLESLDFHVFPSDERARLLQEIDGLVDRDLAPTAQKASKAKASPAATTTRAATSTPKNTGAAATTSQAPRRKKQS